MLVAQRLHSATGLTLVPAEPRRGWMDAIPHGFANRCLPMLIANSLGWEVRSTHRYLIRHDPQRGIEFVWNDDRGRPEVPPISHFGYGIATWNVPWLFRTPTGWDLLAFPSPNTIVPAGTLVLSGLVETDHAHETFTLNWRLAEGAEAQVEVGDPIATLLPYPTSVLAVMPTSLIVAEPAPQAHVEWAASRNAFNSSSRGPKDWQRDYWQRAKRRRLQLSPFTRGDS